MSQVSNLGQDGSVPDQMTWGLLNLNSGMLRQSDSPLLPVPANDCALIFTGARGVEESLAQTAPVRGTTQHQSRTLNPAFDKAVNKNESLCVASHALGVDGYNKLENVKLFRELIQLHMGKQFVASHSRQGEDTQIRVKRVKMGEPVLTLQTTIRKLKSKCAQPSGTHGSRDAQTEQEQT